LSLCGETRVGNWGFLLTESGEKLLSLDKEGDVELSIGDPVFFRPAKAGEIAERFDEYVLVRDGSVQEIVPTYRGEGQTFY
jgi:D-serine deaminase-like pyridoxal phosphate-dependent protein